VDGPDDAQQLRHDDARDLLLAIGVLYVGAIENRFRADGVTHGGDVAGDGAVAHSDEELGVSGIFLIFFSSSTEATAPSTRAMSTYSGNSLVSTMGL